MRHRSKSRSSRSKRVWVLLFLAALISLFGLIRWAPWPHPTAVAAAPAQYQPWAQLGAAPTSIDSLRNSHPRVILLDSEMANIEHLISADAMAKSEFQYLNDYSVGLLNKPVLAYGLDASGDMLSTARELEARIVTLAGIYRITKDQRFADRAIKEMMAASAFPDWNPKKFLDVGELTAGMGIGFDWLYQVMTVSQREAISNAIEQHGLVPFLAQLHANQVRYENNWADVCFGGEVIGALAIAEHNNSSRMDEAKEIVGYARANMTRQMGLYAPDGSLAEGPTYWGYASLYDAMYLSTLTSALGTDFGQSELPGFSLTGSYFISAVGPTNMQANFSDSGPAIFPTPQLFWLARRFGKSDYTYNGADFLRSFRQANPGMSTDSIRLSFLGLVWYSQAPKAGGTPLELMQSFPKVNQVFMRTAWRDPKAWYVAFKGGSLAASHTHLDLGSFILEENGERWGLDLGSDKYTLPGYFGPERWSYYRVRTESHNTLTVGRQNQDLNAIGRVLNTSQISDSLSAVMDLDSAFKQDFSSWKRGVRLSRQGTFLVQDEIVPSSAQSLTWHFLTRARVEVEPAGKVVALHQNGKTLYIHLPANSPFRFTTSLPDVAPPQTPLNGVTDVTILLPNVASPLSLSVLFSEQESESATSNLPLRR